MEVVSQIVKVKNHHIEVELPENFTSKEAEVIVMPVDNDDEKVKKIFDPELFRGAISKDTAEEVSRYIEQSRNEWERNI